jgi:hypothetical protein
MKWAVLIFLGVIVYVFSGTAKDKSNYTTLTATVQSIDWRCGLRSKSRQTSMDDYGDCSGEADFQRRRDNPKASGKRYAGEAVVGASYPGAKDGPPEQAVFRIEASRTEFYTIERGSRVRIEVNKSNPEDVRLVEIVKPAV